MDPTRDQVDGGRPPGRVGLRQGPRAADVAERRLDQKASAEPVPPKPLLTTGEAARALSISVQTVRNWVAAGRLSAVRRGVRTMVPREVVIAEIQQSHESHAQLRRVAMGPGPVGDLPRQDRIYGWMQRARTEGVHFPLAEYNARIPQELIAELLGRAGADLDLPVPWSEHFRPATEDDVLALLSGAE